MSQRQERHITHADDNVEALESPAAARQEPEFEEDLPEFDVDLTPLDSQPGEPADPLATAPTLTGGDPLRDFSDSARRRYELEVGSFAADLRKQSLAHKRFHDGDDVSSRDVVSAAHFLRSYRSHGLLRYLGAIGGVLFGLGAQTLGSMVDKGVYTTGGVLWGVGTTVVGVVLVVVSIKLV
ncbi:MAG TPA: hypothetical protein VFC19_14535 [Candidatus Limnocylindrales bacterium]|nr:hypothetical protein [Candidatus Limnocylindrales bacterium]